MSRTGIITTYLRMRRSPSPADERYFTPSIVGSWPTRVVSQSYRLVVSMTAVDSVWPLIRVGLESDTPRSSPIHSERHRAPRFPFVAGIQVTDLVTEKQLAAHIEDLSLFGCFVETVDPFPARTKVRLRISYFGANVLAQGTVAYSRDNGEWESRSPPLSQAACQS
jgi:PilZ domain